MKLTKLSLIVCVLLLPPLVSAQGRQSETVEQVVSLKIGKSDARGRTTEITQILPSTDAAKRKATEGLVRAKARSDGRNLIIEFTDPLPDKSLKLIIPSNMPLDEAGATGCTVEAGRYAVVYPRKGKAFVKLPFVGGNSVMTAAHRRRKTKFWKGIG